MHTYFFGTLQPFFLCVSIQIGNRGALYFDDTISSIILFVSFWEGYKERVKNVYRLYSILTTFPIENKIDTLVKQFSFRNAIASQIYYLNLDNNFYLFYFVGFKHCVTEFLSNVLLFFFCHFFTEFFAFSFFCLLFFFKNPYLFSRFHFFRIVFFLNLGRYVFCVKLRAWNE